MRRIVPDIDEQLAKIVEQAKKQLTGKKSGAATVTLTIDTSITMPKDFPLPKIIVPLEVKQKMEALVKNTDTEIGWHCTVERDKEANTFTLTDVFVYEQYITGTTTKGVDETYGLWLMELPDEVFHKLRMQGHSHPGFSTQPSPQDLSYYDSLLSDVDDFYVFMILNKKGQATCLIYDVESNILYEDKDIQLLVETDPVEEWALDQIREHLVTKKPEPQNVVRQVYPASQNRVEKGGVQSKFDIDGYSVGGLSNEDRLYDEEEDWLRQYYAQRRGYL